MTSRPPPRTSITRSRCSVRTSRNSMSARRSRTKTRLLPTAALVEVLIPRQAPTPAPALLPHPSFSSPASCAGYSSRPRCGCAEVQAC